MDKRHRDTNENLVGRDRTYEDPNQISKGFVDTENETNVNEERVVSRESDLDLETREEKLDVEYESEEERGDDNEVDDYEGPRRS